MILKHETPHLRIEPMRHRPIIVPYVSHCFDRSPRSSPLSSSHTRDILWDYDCEPQVCELAPHDLPPRFVWIRDIHMQHCPQTYQDRREAAGNNIHRSASIRLTNPAFLELSKSCVRHDGSSMRSEGLGKKEEAFASETESLENERDKDYILCYSELFSLSTCPSLTKLASSFG